ncbi:hypothetical protein [Streptomyces sp. NPDC050848]|uniref:hypothetical protein n=1 Tax=Streptomyces sp. NPDC050848 TaxID=3155791 RepID=UPI0033F8FEBF
MSELYAGASTDTVEPEITDVPAPQQSADGDAFGEPVEPAEPGDFPEDPDEPADQLNPVEPEMDADELTEREDAEEATDASGGPEALEHGADVDEPELPEVPADSVQDVADAEEAVEPAAVTEIPEPSETSTSEPEGVTEPDVDVESDPTPGLEEEPVPDADVTSEATSGTGDTEHPDEPTAETETETDPEGQEVDETAVRIERPDIDRMYDKNAAAVEYGDPIKEVGVPLFQGEPGRGQVAQGSLSDCGIVAVIGAAASARPEAITENIKENEDGTYSITVHEAHYDGNGYVPGERVELTVTQDLPVLKGHPDTAAFVSVNQAAWPALLEKAAAGIDVTWSEGRHDVWEQDWSTQTDYKVQYDETVNSEDMEGPTPSGYGRLNQGTPYYNQAELLTQLTGEPTDLVTFPQGDGAAAELEQQIKSKLSEGKAVVAATRGVDAANGETFLPKDLVGGHAYEIVSYDAADGTFTLHNPWNSYQPEPLTANEIVEYCQPKGYPGQYVALR